MLLPQTNDALTILTRRIGFFSWDLATDRLYGDEIIAEIFSCNPVDMIEGVPIIRIMAQISSDDRPRIAEAIHTAIITGQPYQARYSVERQGQMPMKVVALGRCLRSLDGTPSIYTGTVFELVGGFHVSNDPLQLHAEAALELAQKSGNELAARYFSSGVRALTSAGGQRS